MCPVQPYAPQVGRRGGPEFSPEAVLEGTGADPRRRGHVRDRHRLTRVLLAVGHGPPHGTQRRRTGFRRVGGGVVVRGAGGGVVVRLEVLQVVREGLFGVRAGQR